MKKAKKGEKASGTETNVSKVLTDIGVDSTLKGDELRSALAEKFGSEEVANYAMELIEEYKQTEREGILTELYKMREYVKDKEGVIEHYGEDGKGIIQKVETNPTAEGVLEIGLLNTDASINLKNNLENVPERMQVMSLVVKVKDPTTEEGKKQEEEIFKILRKAGVSEDVLKIAEDAIMINWAKREAEKQGNEAASEELDHTTTKEEADMIRKKYGLIDDVKWNKGLEAVSYAKEKHEEGEEMDQPIQNMLNALQLFSKYSGKCPAQ